MLADAPDPKFRLRFSNSNNISKWDSQEAVWNFKTLYSQVI